MNSMDIAIVALTSLILAFVAEWYLCKQHFKNNGIERAYNYGNVCVIFGLTFGGLFSIVNFKRTSDQNALKHIKIGDPPF